MKKVIQHQNAQGRDSVYIQNHPFRQDGKHADEGHWAAMVERCIVTRNWKLILNSIRPPELYQIQEDPEERINRWDDTGLEGVKKDLFDCMEKWAREVDDGLTLSKWLLYKWNL